MNFIKLSKINPIWVGVILAFLIYSCDLGVENPEDIEDEELNTVEGIEAVVNGTIGDFSAATTTPGGGGIYNSGAVLSDEIVHCGTWIPIRMLSDGISINTEPENQSRWAESSRARWTAENAIERIQEVDEVENDGEEMITVTLYAGLANRMMGDNFCDAVIDGGEREHHTVYHERAVDFFTDAIELASAAGEDELMYAAYGGRAQSHMMLRNWDEAAADANELGTGFSYEQVHSDNDSREYNGVWEWTTDGNQGDQYTVWGTPFADWGTEINDQADDVEGDPRVQYEKTFTDDDQEEFNTGGDDSRPLFYAHKYDSRASDIPVVKGTEMRLIEAEVHLRNGNIEEAINSINEVRDLHDLDTFNADDYQDEQEAWELLMKEKGIELWLEGRRVADLRRWMEDEHDVPFEVVREDDEEWSNVLDVEEMCLEVSSTEEDSNPNL